MALEETPAKRAKRGAEDDESAPTINEALLSDFCSERLGFELPVDGLDKLTKAQASVIIDALLKSDQPATVTRSRAADPDDPWADVPLPPEPGR